MLNAVQNLTSKSANVVSSTEQPVESQVQKTTQDVVKNKAPTATLPHELNIFTMSDHKVMELIYETHVHADDSFDEDSLYAIVKNILNPATQIVDKIVQGSQVHLESVQEFVPKANFSVPLCTLKQIGSEFCCKAAGEEVAHKTAMSILQKLSNYQWEAKAVLAIAAFALEYGDFWMLAQNYQSDHLAKSLAILKRVPLLTNPLELQKKRQAVLELNSVIKTLLQVIQLFDEFEKISISYDHKDVPHVKVALDHIPVDVYWTILTIVACATKLNLLISDEEKPLDLSPYAQKVYYINNKLRIQLTMCRKQIEVIKLTQKIMKLFSTPTEIMESLKALIFIKDDVQTIIDGSTNKPVTLEVLRKKYVLLFMSGLDITNEDIEDMKVVHEGIKKENTYAIVWIPVVEQWTDELGKKFEILRAKMPWFIIPSFSSPAGFKFIKEVWHFKGKPMVVVLNPQSKQQNDDAFHIIKIWKFEAFPFDETRETELNERQKWIQTVIPPSVHPQLTNWIKEDKYIFLYGGKDNAWIQEFTKITTAFINDPIFKEANIKIELASVGKTAKGGEDRGILSSFWGAVENLFFTKSKKPVAVNPVTQEIYKLMSYKNESGWAILTKGSNVILVGHGVTILRVLEEFEKWKVSIREKGFEIGFKEYYKKITVPHCCKIDIPNDAGKAPDKMPCPECQRVMETLISYKCCHIDGPASAYH